MEGVREEIGTSDDQIPSCYPNRFFSTVATLSSMISLTVTPVRLAAMRSLVATLLASTAFAAPPLQLQKFLASDGSSRDQLGSAVAIDGSFALVGAPFEASRGDSSGGAYVYSLESGEQIHKLVADDGAAGDRFGLAIALHENFAVVGAPGVESGRGAVYLFELETGNLRGTGRINH